LAVKCIVQKSRAGSIIKAKGQMSRSPGTKKIEKCGILFGARFSCGIFFGPRGCSYAGGKISGWCL